MAAILGDECLPGVLEIARFVCPESAVTVDVEQELVQPVAGVPLAVGVVGANV